MPISDVASLVGGAALGAPFSEILSLLIEEAKKVKDFKPLSQDLASTMERLVPVLEEIDSVQEGVDPGKGELKVLIKTIERAEVMVRKCSRVRGYSIFKKALYTRQIERINQDLLRFCQIELQLIHHRNLLKSMRSMAIVTTKIDLLSDTGKELFVVPDPEEVLISWLDRPLRELKKMLFENRVVTVVVSAPSAFGKTTLVTKLCHDADVKGKFKQILFITVAKAPNIRLILQRLLEHTGCQSNEIVNNLDAGLCIQQLGENGSMLVVLDDVYPEEESLLDKFLIQLPDYKILVTSRFEFPRFGPTFYLEPLIDEDVKTIFIECTLQPNCQSCTKRDHLLQKIQKRCNGLPLAMNPPCSICDGCNSVIDEHERPVNVLGVIWHPECFCCDACHKPIAIQEIENHVSNSRGKFHRSCYIREHHVPNCYVCKETIPFTAQGIIKYNEHPFWKEKYCPSHDGDGTAKCCSCERLERKGTNYVMVGDGRWLCLECLESSVMDSHEVQPLHFEIREFFEGLNMKIEKEFPLLLVEKQALNKATKIDDQNEVVTRGICLSETQTVISVSKVRRTGLRNELIEKVTESQRVVRDCEVTAILILYGLPRLLIGSILAHEMMHAYLRLNGHSKLNEVDEEGICQVLGDMWLESETYATTAATTTKKGEQSCFEKKFVEFCRYQIKTDKSPVYGDGFRKVNKMMETNHYSLKNTLKELVRAS